MRLLLVLVFSFICTPAAFANSYLIQYDSNCRQAYHAYMRLQTKAGDAFLGSEQKSLPNNLSAVYIADYKDCLQMLFNANAGYFAQIKPHIDERIKLLELGPKDNEWYRVYKAGIYWHWALMYFRLGEQLKAALYFRKAYLLMKDNEKDYPNFSYNQVYLSLCEILLGSLPENYKWIAATLGYKGNVNKGATLMNQFLQQHKPGDLLYDEAQIYYAYILFYFKQQKEAAYNYIMINDFADHENLTALFVKCNIALNFRKAEQAINMLKPICNELLLKEYPIIYFELGSAYFYRSDTNCQYYFQQFLVNYRGSAFIKETWLMLAHSYYLQNKLPQANYCKQMIIKAGNALTDADKHALRFANGELWPQQKILQAHILTDGGYYNKALIILLTAKEADFQQLADKAEYWLRLGRVYEELNENEKALNCYFLAIARGKFLPNYFAARAALQSAYIYEKQQNTNEAVKAYKQVLNMPAHDYQSSLDQQAKAGLSRLYE